MPSDVAVRDLERILSRFPRSTIAGALQVVDVVNDTTITVAYVSPRGVVPNFSQAGASQYVGALVEWMTGPLCGLKPPQSEPVTLDLATVVERPQVVVPDTPPNINDYGRVTNQIASITSTGTPIVTTLTFVDAMPVLPNAGDQFLVYQPPQPTVKVGNAQVNIAGSVDAIITQADVNLPVTGSVEISAGTVDATITQATIDLPVTGRVEISAGTVDAHITQATINLPVTGNVEITNTIDANIAQASIDLPITGSIEISAGQVDANITQATINLPITGSLAIANAFIDLPITGNVHVSSGEVNTTVIASQVDLPITGTIEISAGTVDATIQNAYIPVSGNVNITGGVIDANITQATIDLPITGNVSINAGTVDANITNAYLPVSGNVNITGGVIDANITQATIDLPITGNVEISAGTVDANITNAYLPVSGNVNITGGVIDANITQATIDLPVTGKLEISAGTVNATITDSSINLPVTGAVTITEGTIVETNITKATVNIPVTGTMEISAGTVDANITNAYLPVSGNVNITGGVIDANITKATIDLPITGNVEITAGNIDANITNAYLPVSGNVTITSGVIDATITHAAIDLPITGNVEISAGTVDANITNAYIPISGAVQVTAGTVDANITNAYLPVSGNVNITGGSLDAHITEATINVPITGEVVIAAGTVDANISNATLDTNSTVINEQLKTSQGYALVSPAFTIAQSSTSTVQGDVAVFANKAQIVLTSDVDVGIISANDYTYNITLQPQTVFPDGTSVNTSAQWQFNDLTTIADTTTNSALLSSLALGYNMASVNNFYVGITPTTATAATDTVTLYMVVNGQSTEIADQNVNLAVYTPNDIALAVGYQNANAEPVAVTTATPMPVTPYELNTDETGFTQVRRHNFFTSVASVAGSATLGFTGFPMSRVYGLWLTAGGNAGGILRVEFSGGAWAAYVMTPNSNTWYSSRFHTERGYMTVSGYPKVVQLYGASTATVYYDLKIEYE